MIIPGRSLPHAESTWFHVGVEKNMTQELLGIAKAITDKSKRNKPSILVIHSDKKFSKKHAVSQNPGTYKFSSSGVEREYLNPSPFDYADIESSVKI